MKRSGLHFAAGFARGFNGGAVRQQRDCGESGAHRVDNGKVAVQRASEVENEMVLRQRLATHVLAGSASLYL